MKRSICQVMTGCLLWSLLVAFPSYAAPEPAELAATADAREAETGGEDLRDPAALAELQRATDFLSALPQLQLRTEVVYDVIQEDGRRLQFEKHGEISLQRPDRMYVEVFLDDGRHRQFWYDGTTLSFAARSRNLHTQVKAPPTIDATLDMLEELFKDPMPLADLLYSDLDPLEQRALEADVVGDSLVAGRLCRHLAFRGEAVDWQIWIEQGEKPFIRKLAVSYREIPGVPQYVAWIDEWKTPQHFSEERFRFTAPEGSEFINILVMKPRRSEQGGTQ